jgi:hypothetical protein
MSKNTDLGSLVNYIKGQVTGRLNAPAYTSATAFTGTIAGFLGFDTSGNILTSSGSGIVGSGTTNYVPKFTTSTAIGNSLLYDSGTAIGIGTTSPDTYASRSSLSVNGTNGGIITLQVNGTKVTEFYAASGGLTQFTTTGSFGFSGGSAAFSSQISSTNLLLTQDNGSASQIIIRDSTTNNKQLIIGYNTTSNGYGNIQSVYQGIAYTQLVLQRDGGNLSVGNTNNTYKLDVTGDVNISGTYRVNGTAIGGVTGSGSTNLMPLWTSTTGLGNSIIYNNAGNLGINSTTDGYTLNAIRSASTTFNDVFRGTGSTIEIFARFMQDESTKKGIAIGYNTSFSYSGIFGTQDSSALRLGILVGSSFKAKISINTDTVSMDLPTSAAGLPAGSLYSSAGVVQIV